MNRTWKVHLHCWWVLMRADWHGFRKVLIDRIVNSLIWGLAVIGIAGYVLPLLGNSASYGAFTAVGVLVGVGVFEGYGRIAELVTEMENDRPILYYATLPLSTNLMIFRIMVSNALRGGLVSLTILPLAKLLLGNTLNFSHFQVVPFILMLVFTNLFYGACTVLLACKIPSILGISNIWMRWVFPFWFFGGFQFSQGDLLRVFPRAALLNLLNPMVYITEGMRAAVLGQGAFMNIWICCLVTCFAWLLCTWRGIVAFRKRLDMI